MTGDGLDGEPPDIIACPGCRQSVRPEAADCPRCGYLLAMGDEGPPIRLVETATGFRYDMSILFGLRRGSVKKGKRKRPLGWIDQLPSGRWRARIWLQGRRRTFTADVRHQVEAWLDRRRSEKFSEQLPTLASKPNVTLADVAGEYLEDCQHDRGLAAKTLRGYRSAVQAALEGYGHVRVADVDPPLLKRILQAYRARGWAASTRRNRINAITGICRYAMSVGYVPARELPVRRPPIRLDTRPEVYSPAEMGELLRAAGELGDGRLEVAVRLAYDAGLRLEEAYRFRAHDLRDLLLTVPRAKGGGTRTLPVPRTLALAIAAHPDPGENYWRCGAERTFQRALRDVWLAAGFESVQFHRLRHTWASRLANNPTDPATPWELMAWGGWRTLTMVRRYFHDPIHVRRGPVDTLAP